MSKSPSPNLASRPPDRDFSLLRLRTVLAVAFLFAAIAAITHNLAHAICAAASEDCPRYWPISVFELRAPPTLSYPNLTHVLLAIALSAGFMLAVYLLRRLDYPWHLVTALGFILILGSNLIQGWQHGLRQPTDGLGIHKNQYYHDALTITDPIEAFSSFTDYQANLRTHSRTHPPGAVITYFFLVKYLRDPIAISIAVAALATLVSSVSLYTLVRSEVAKPQAGYILLLFLILPAIQIYFLASLDALIVAFALLSISLVVSQRSVAAAIAGGLSLFILSLLTFAFVFVGAILFFVWLKLESRRIAFPLAIAMFLAAHLVISTATYFSYLESFRIASSLENPQGYRLVAHPLDFALTRVEGLAELALFAGPFVLAVSCYGWKRRDPSSSLSHIVEAGAAALILMLLTGAFRTGETARAAMFTYPILLLPIGGVISRDIPYSSSAASALLALVFVQGLLMQLVGNYFW